MQRHSQNQNLIICPEGSYRDMPVQVNKGPFFLQYLEGLRNTMAAAISQYSRVFAFRVDLRFSAKVKFVEVEYSNRVLSRFIGSFKAKIQHNRQVARAGGKYAHDTCVRYVWARELGRHGVPHYHLVFLLNFDAFCALGKFESGRCNMFNRLEEAWASALGVELESVRGLVEIPANPAYCLRRHDRQSQEDFFYRASYLCKVATKMYGGGIHSFGTSRG